MRPVVLIFLVMCGHAFSADLKPLYQPENIRPLKAHRSPFSQLKQAIQDKQTKAIQDLVDNNDALLDEVDNEHWSALHVAAFYGNLSAVQFLHGKIQKRWLSRHFYEKRTKTNKHTPLHVAIIGGHQDVVTYLVEQCDVEISEEHLGLAVAAKSLPLTKFFIEKLGSQDAIHAMRRARRGETSGEILFYLGTIINYNSLFGYPQTLFKEALEGILGAYELPVACEFIRGLQECDPQVKLEDILDKNRLGQVRDYINHPEKYVGYSG